MYLIKKKSKKKKKKRHSSMHIGQKTRLRHEKLESLKAGEKQS